MRKIVVFYLTILFFASCVPNQKQEVSIEILPNNATSILIEEHISHIEIIPLETTTTSLLRGVKTVKFVDNFIFIEDTGGSGVYAFDRTGKFISKIGSRGEGPESYISIATFFVDEKNRYVVLIDNMREAFIKHDFYGNFQYRQQVSLEAIGFPFQALWMKDNSLLLNQLISRHEGIVAYILMECFDSQETSRFFPYYPITAENYMTDFANPPMVRASDGSINLIMPLNDTIFNFHNGKITPRYRVEFSERRMAPRGSFSGTRIGNSFFDVMREYGGRGYFTGFTGIFETKNFILLNYRYRGVLMGYYLFDRRTGIGGYQRYTVNPGEFPFWRIISSHENAFVSAIDAESLLDMKEGFDRNAPNNTRLFEVLDSLQFDDNPVLLLYHMK